MILKKITLKNFKCFETFEVIFDKINLIQGAIGIGKSTILQALIFALYGYSEGILADLPTRGKATSCKVTATIEDSGHIIEVIREFPLKLTVKEDGKTIKMSTSEGNSYLIERFGSRQDFFQFRIVDAYSKETNLLEQGNVVFKKILFAGTDEKFNEVRNNLNVIKLERERLNKDGIVLNICYPSEKRLEVLNASLNETVITYQDMERDISETEKGLRNSELKFSEHESKIVYLNKQITDIDNLRSSFDSKLNNSESYILNNKTKIKNCEKEILNIDNLRSSFDTELFQKVTRHGEVPKILEDINKQIKNIDTLRSSYDTKLQNTKSHIETLRQEIKTCELYRNDIDKEILIITENNVCNVCKQPLKEIISKNIIIDKNKQKQLYLDKILNMDAEIIDLQDQIKRLNEEVIIERNKKLEEYKKKIEDLNQEDIENCARIPILYDSIAKEKEDTKIKLTKTIEGYKTDIAKATEEIEGLRQAIVTEKAQKLEEFKKEIVVLQIEIISLTEDIKNTKEILAQDKDIRDGLLPKKEKIQSLKVILENRLKQRQFIYTEKDVIIVKKAIEELDKLSSVYLVETVHSLEPIINSVLEKIGFEITFDVDIKGKFNILLSKDDIQYKYTDLSCGQRLILQIALKLSLLLQQSKTGIILSDEGLSALENNNLEDIINLFKELNFQLVFVLHRASIEDPEINVIKLGGNDEKMSEV